MTKPWSSTQAWRKVAALAAAVLAGLLAAACSAARRPPVVLGAPASTSAEAQPDVALEPAMPPPTATPLPESASRPVANVQGDITVSVWTEPRRLPAGGGQAQVIVRVLKRNGRPLPGVEVRITSSSGTLFSQGKILTTDARGMVRDSLTTSRPADLVVSAGGREQRLALLLGGVSGVDD